MGCVFRGEYSELSWEWECCRDTSYVADFNNVVGPPFTHLPKVDIEHSWPEAPERQMRDCVMIVCYFVGGWKVLVEQLIIRADKP